MKMRAGFGGKKKNCKGGSGAENTLVGAGFTYFGRRNAGF